MSTSLIRRSLPLALTLTGALLLASCGDDSSGTAASTPSSSAAAATSTAATTAAATASSSAPAAGGTSKAAGGSSVSVAPTHANLAYATGSAAQKLDLYLPANPSGKVPVVVVIHGGAFKGGDKSGELQQVPAILAAGYAVASVNYRLSGEAKYPAAIQDVKAAVRWLRANAATYGLDPDAIASWGGSAGGYLAAMLGATGKTSLYDDPALGNAGTSSAVQATVAWFPPVDFGSMDSQFAASKPAACSTVQTHESADSPESVWLGAALPTIPAKVKESSVLTYLTPGTSLPPFVVAAGDSDCLIPYQQGQSLAAAVKSAGGNSSWTLLPGAGHGDAAFPTTQTQPALAVLKAAFGR